MECRSRRCVDRVVTVELGDADLLHEALVLLPVPQRGDNLPGDQRDHSEEYQTGYANSAVYYEILGVSLGLTSSFK